MIASRSTRLVLASISVALIAFASACGSDDAEKANPSGGGASGSDGGGSGGAGATGGSAGSGGSCAFGAPQVNTCNLLQNDCPCGAKCVPYQSSTTPPKIERACVAITGTKSKGEACTRVKQGVDDCAAGLFCNTHGLSAAVASKWACVSVCEKTSNCTSTETCSDTMPGDQSIDKVISGICLAKCEPFNVAAGCAAGTECIAFPSTEGIYTLTCSPNFGSAAEGAVCTSNVGECGPGLACVKTAWESENHCRSFCDPTHACPTDRLCKAISKANFMTCMPLNPDAGTDSGTDAAGDAGADAASDASLD